MKSTANNNLDFALKESTKKDKIFLGLFIPLILTSLVILIVSLISGIILRKDPFLIIVFIIISLVFFACCVALFIYIITPEEQIKINISTKIVEFCMVFEKNPIKINIDDIKEINIPKTIFSSFISLSKVEIILTNGKKYSFRYLKSPEAFKTGFSILIKLLKLDEVH